MPRATRTPRRIEAAAGEIAFNNALWHVGQARYWRAQKAAGGAVPAGRCEHHARRHERRVIEIARQSEAVLASRCQAAGAKA